MLNSADYKKLADFYGKVLNKKPEMVDDEHGYIGYLAGSCFISICAHDKVQTKNLTPERFILFFESTDVQTEFDRVKQIEGAEVIKEPYSPDASNTHMISTLADPDGNYFQIVTPWNAK
jgi:predicted enzyme related to lactoylglutathione lyase